TTHGACKKNKFECGNGSCISSFEVCNGVRNCPDGSDETGLTCVSQRQHCSKPYFQCSYGACVIGTAACNGVNDCADGSDETVLRCGTEDDIRDFNRKQQGNCQENELKCPSQICIDKSRLVCDGQDDCGDGSGYDESVALCGHLECPDYSFKCATGSCISSQLVCNGKADCFDGSDEAPLLCNTTAGPVVPVTSNPLSEQIGCPLPSGDERPILKDHHGNVLTPPIIRGTVKFSCNSGYFREGPESSHCANRKWSVHVVPKCVKYCDSLRDSTGRSENQLQGYSTRATCVLNGQEVNCLERYHPPGTEVKFVCATGFYTQQTILPDMKCLPSGHWNRERVRCDQECGQIATPVEKFTALGYAINNTVVPWHVGLYSWHNERDYNFLCGGSLLTPDLVITAAHCVFNEATAAAYSPETFQVIAAKFYRDYNVVSQTEKRQNVEKIVLAANYKGNDDNYVNDLALLILEKPYELNTVIRPVCVHFALYAEKERINDNVQGKFAGWNFKDKRELQFVPAESKINSACLVNLRDISPDKFCMYTVGQSLACHGDSGGGFTAELETKTFTSRSLRHYLFGIISTAPNPDQCAHSLTTLTNIQYFEDLIKGAISNSIDRRS
ncbi:hypothetical protein KR222_007248, partial [Zaprionus bogoriensis]